MKKANTLLFCTIFLLISCNHSRNKDDIEKWKTEILEVEKEFNDLAQKEGIAKAFATYAAEHATIKRNGKLIQGKAAIAQWYKNDSRPGETLTWKPDYVDVSSSGDLAYTYGGYVFTTIDSTGTSNEKTGIFHTVWKRQADGSWKFVWD